MIKTCLHCIGTSVTVNKYGLAGLEWKCPALREAREVVKKERRDQERLAEQTASLQQSGTITISNILGGIRSSCTYVGAPSLKQLSKCTTFVRVSNQFNDTFVG